MSTLKFVSKLNIHLIYTFFFFLLSTVVVGGGGSRGVMEEVMVDILDLEDISFKCFSYSLLYFCVTLLLKYASKLSL